MVVKGILHVKKETQHVSDKFAKREFVLLDNSSKFPQHILFQLTQNNCDLIENINVGDEVEVHFNLQGREWTSKDGEVKYFNTISAWKIVALNTTVVNTQQNPDTFIQDDNSQLPF